LKEAELLILARTFNLAAEEPNWLACLAISTFECCCNDSMTVFASDDDEEADDEGNEE
jgi:hypothetical protein